MRRLAIVALFAGLWSAGCVQSPKPPYELAFDAVVESPRVLTSSDEITVPLTVVNTGRRAWDPASVHVSYHWLWPIPRELVRRSRTVPYQDGIRTEVGDRAIPAGARVALQGRLLAPDVPGLYWLQWDMVEEGVTWFAQVSPRQPRTLVVVLPPAAWLLAPLPLVVAVAASVAPAGPSVAIADVVWCAATFAIKPLVVEHEALLEPTYVSHWVDFAIAALVPLFALLLLPRRARPFVLLFAGIFGSLVLLADVVYYRFFDDVWSTPALLAARQTGHVWGSVGSLLTVGLLWLVADWPFACWAAVRAARSPAWPPLRARAIATATAIAVVVAAGATLSAPRVIAAAPFTQLFRARSIVEQLGPFGYHVYDTLSYVRSTWLRAPASADAIDQAAEWFRERAPLRAGGSSFGVARGRNLIVVQVESLQDFVVDFRVGGQEVMPNLRRWAAADALRFTNVTDETSEGRTSDAEFATLTSLLPLDHGAVAFRYPANHYVALPRVLAEHGYATLSAVPFEPGFWNRLVMHPLYGFQRSLFESDFQMTEQIGWGLNDRDFLQQMVPRLEQLPRPFAAWMITLSLHHPFEAFPAARKVLKLGALEGTSFGNYLHAMRFCDQALEDFRVALAHDGLLDHSVLMVFGDHDAGFTRNPSLARTIGIDSTDLAWTVNDRVPLFIRVPPPDGHRAAAVADGNDNTIAERAEWPRGFRTLPAGQTDVAPTLLSLLGIDASPLPYLGRNLLGAPGDVPVPRPYGDWLDAHHLFVAHAAAPVCYDLKARAIGPPDACRATSALARRARDISRLVVVDDLQDRLRGEP